MTNQADVVDWATDFDVFEPAFMADPGPVYAELRERAPVAHSDRWGGAWMPTRYEDVAAVAHDTVHFSSRDVGVTPGPNGASLLVAPPITSDPPFHTASRRLLLPAFSPKSVDVLEPITRGIARELLDAIEATGTTTADAAVQYAQYLPIRVIAQMIGLPRDDEEKFSDWVKRVLQVGPTNPEIARAANLEILAYFRDHVARRREERAPDLINYLMDSELDGAPLTDKHVLGTCFLLLLAGIDTTWSSIGSSLLHLAQTPADRDRLVAEPELIPTAVEEFLRAFAPVTMARQTVVETEVGGRTIQPGERMLLAFPAANRDPEVFDRPDEIVIDRAHNRHLAFGVGIHRCVG